MSYVSKEVWAQLGAHLKELERIKETKKLLQIPIIKSWADQVDEENENETVFQDFKTLVESKTSCISTKNSDLQ